ncbi:hypothetical protein CK234_04069 [Phocaeicola vulgatus]|jgi:hypothetical protein|uniref:Uncharacterized protein n=3 Tax=Phocaeicola vulgatus TaxID=821 RepID=A0A397WBF5_PHOVU|nr:hypothetical protein [Phocaeicola vulgatus]RIB31069.1 hypothetical protein CK234_04069 [Phocaeicola vulgatus]TSE46659.1 hypothetical protein EH214_04116 [Phocaeicola vulgatus]
MGYGGDVCLPLLERIIYIEVKIGPHRHNDVVLFRCGFECPAVIGVFVICGPVHAGLGLDGKYAYGVSLFERAFLGGTRLGDGKGDTAVFRAWLLLFLPAGGYGQQDKEAADYRCY